MLRYPSKFIVYSDLIYLPFSTYLNSALVTVEAVIVLG